MVERQSKSERRHAFWARNTGGAVSPPSRIRLKFYYRSGLASENDPWTMHNDFYLDIPALQLGQESKALVTKLLYSKDFWRKRGASRPKEYKWEFWVDSREQVREADEKDNYFLNQSMYPGHIALETGPSGSFH